MRRALPLLTVMLLASCSSSTPTLDQRVKDIDSAVELYQTVDGIQCDTPSPERPSGSTVAVDCEDGATIVWDVDSTDDPDQRALTAAILSDDHGIDAVVGVNVTIMNIDPAEVAEQIGGEHV